MKKAMKILISISICLAIIFSLTGCSSNAEMTEENVTATVESATEALKEFDKKALEKYVDSQTLSVILGMAKGHEQFSTLGKAIFENLEVEIQNINLEEGTVTLNVKNKSLALVANNFAKKLLEGTSKLALINLLNDDSFLDSSLEELVSDINTAEMQEEYTTITLKIIQNKRNLTLSFDDDAENAVSGGALKAIKSLI